jgi:hypothetical protein
MQPRGSRLKVLLHWSSVRYPLTVILVTVCLLKLTIVDHVQVTNQRAIINFAPGPLGGEICPLGGMFNPLVHPQG